eukprot:scaffold7918_cov165-Amphora_coffeaeformis.AAC.4
MVAGEQNPQPRRETSNPCGFVGEWEAGQRLFQVAHDPRCSKSGVYWSWNGGPREGRGKAALEKGGQISGGGGAGGGWDSIFENDQSAKVLDVDTALNLYKYATEITHAEWPDLKQVVSPCPTLKVVGAVTKGMVQREELKRMREMGRPGLNADGTAVTPAEPVKVSKVKKVALVTDRVASGVLKNTVGRVARFAGRRLLGRVPETALQGSYHPAGDQKAVAAPAVEDDLTLETLESYQELLEQEVTLKADAESIVDTEDEALFTKIYDEKNSPQPVNGSSQTGSLSASNSTNVATTASA